MYVVHSVMSDSSQPHGVEPTRLLHPWDFPGKNTGVGCHALLQGDLPDPGIGPESFTSPALVSGFFTTSASWRSPSSLILEEVRDSVEQPLKSQ